MKLPNDIRQALQRRYDSQHCAWLAAPSAAGSWPLTVPLGLPTQAQALRQSDAVRAWVDAWRCWKGVGEVTWVDRQWQVLGAQRLPAAYSVGSPAQLAAAIGQGERWSLAAQRHACLRARWPGFQACQPRVFEVLAEYPAADFERLVAFVEWVLAHPASGLLPRQLPISGIDSKWLETRKGIISDLLTERRADGPAGDFHQLCGLSRPPPLMRLRVLDPLMRSQLGGMGDFAAPVAELAQLPLRPQVVFIVENLQSGLALPDMPGAVAFMALGYGVDMLRPIPWIAAGQCVYWGDIDTHGFSILARARRLFPGMVSMLMDEATLHRHAHLWGTEPMQDTGADPELLSAEELGVYLGLRQNQWGQQLRLEQERLAWDDVLQALEKGPGLLCVRKWDSPIHPPHQMSNSIAFFETQFGHQVSSGDLELNPFEAAALPHLRGKVLDFGCGLGNLSVAAARQGCTVLALDAAPTAIRHLESRSAREGLAITALHADLRTYDITDYFDGIAAIGLLMFFGPATARRQLQHIQDHVHPAGIAIVNVLIEGTTFLDMFDPVDHYLFARNELREAFAGWEIVSETFDDFPAPGNSVKCFATIIARKSG